MLFFFDMFLKYTIEITCFLTTFRNKEQTFIDKENPVIDNETIIIDKMQFLEFN